MNKKVFAVFSILLIAAFILSACSGQSNTASKIDASMFSASKPEDLSNATIIPMYLSRPESFSLSASGTTRIKFIPQDGLVVKPDDRVAGIKIEYSGNVVTVSLLPDYNTVTFSIQTLSCPNQNCPGQMAYIAYH